MTHWKPPETMTMEPPEGDCEAAHMSSQSIEQLTPFLKSPESLWLPCRPRSHPD